VRAAPQRLGRAHRRADAVPARLVARRRHHTPPARVAADDDRLAAKLRALELFDRREERVEVEVRDDHGSGRIGAVSHDTDKLIRQLSLVAYLMAERRPITARDVKSNVEGYSEMSDEAFARRFYSDRSELVGLGVPLQSQRDEFTGEELYTLRSDQYFLPPLELKDEELAALQTALMLLDEKFAYAEPLRLALQNLALGRPGFAEARTETAERVEVSDPDYSAELAGRLTKLETAISKGRTVRFRYWSIARDVESDRTANPYALFHDGGSWYVVGKDLDAQAERTFRVSRIRGEIRFATRRERDFRAPEIDLAPFRNRPPWQVGEIVGDATVAVADDTAWWVKRFYGDRVEVEDGAVTTPYADLTQLASWVLRQEGRAVPLGPPELVAIVEDGLRRVVESHEGVPRKPRKEVERPAAGPSPPERTAGPVTPERFAVLQSLLAYLLAACGDGPSGEVAAADLVERFGIPYEHLDEHLQLLNLVNFGGGCYAVYAQLRGDVVRVDKELYGDTFRRAPRLTPLEARAIRLALEFVGPMIAAEAHTTLDRVRRKLEETFGQFELTEAPEPSATSDEARLVETLTDAIAKRRLVEFDYLPAAGGEASRRRVEPYKLERELPYWYVHTWDRTRDAERTFRLDRMREAKLLDETFDPRPGLSQRKLSESREAKVWYSKKIARYRIERGAHRLVDGSALEDLRVGSADWLVGEILSHMGEAVVLAPDDLRREVAERAAAVLESGLAAKVRR
jgi:proteasome accessory factor C